MQQHGELQEIPTRENTDTCSPNASGSFFTTKRRRANLKSLPCIVWPTLDATMYLAPADLNPWPRTSSIPMSLHFSEAAKAQRKCDALYESPLLHYTLFDKDPNAAREDGISTKTAPQTLLS